MLDPHYQASQLRTKSLIKTVEAIAVFFAAIFTTAILPSLLIQFVYAGQGLLEQPVVLTYIPLVSFVIAVGYFVYALVGNLLREGKARRLELEAESYCSDCGGDCGCGDITDAELAELEAMIEAAEADTTSSSKAENKKAGAKKTSRKTTKKSTKSKK